MEFYELHYLWFLLLIPLMYIIHRFVSSKKRRQAMKFSNVAFIKSALKKKSHRHGIVFFLNLLVVAFMILGFADPHIPLEQEKEGVNVVLVLDISGSMQATDYKPSRIEAAKASAETLLESLETKDHAGIIIFETGATTAAYLSPFKEKVIEKLRAIKPKQGRTAIGDGLSLGLDMALSIPNKKKVVILLSDGVANSGVITVEQAAQYARQNDIQVFTIGMGSDDDVVLGYDFFGRPQLADKVDEATLQAIADHTEGKYYRSVDTKTLEEIYEKISDNIEREEEKTSIKEWFFFAALLVFIFQLYLRYGGKRVIS